MPKTSDLIAFRAILKAFSLALPDGRMKELAFSLFQEISREIKKGE